ncbi:MAG: hypothetical protein JWR11_926 [Mycobacterium sp.]|jgi:hypothetical protein|nr:hypothetical protein [Mycobacterium sp.]MDT5178993.1 hypothetical protein [Mycobacterium sp.]
MKATVTPEAQAAIADVAERHGISQEAVLTMLIALENGGGTMAQFSIPELGGSGQWMRGGMTMVGNMFDNALKARVDALCGELVAVRDNITVFPAATAAGWWPVDLGLPSASGGQNDARYAVFPSTRRLATRINGVTRVYDTGEHRIAGVQQQQAGGPGSAQFTSQIGTFDVSSLRELDTQEATGTPAAAPAPPPRTHAADPAGATSQATAATVGATDPATIIAAIESLAGLHERGILSDEEFALKKTELLGRL